MAALPDPRAAANRIKRVLHSIFEELYCFDLEDKRKKNLGPTVKWLEKMDGTSKFVVAYVVQAALGGHSIPVDAGTLAALRVLDLVTDKEAAAGEVPGLERAVGKSKGVEFGSLLHQLGADYLANPFSPQVREILLAIDPEASKRFPQRRQPRPETPPVPERRCASKVRRRRLPRLPGRLPQARDGRGRRKLRPPPSRQRQKARPPKRNRSKARRRWRREQESGRSAQANRRPRKNRDDKAPEKPHDRPPKAEKAEKAEKQSKAEKPEQAEKHEKRSRREASKTPPAADGLGKRKPR